jgi:folate-dependent phosphoribosylglycinamide formyltransferase PurN
MKKIIALIKPNAPLIYFVDQINRKHSIHTVIIEDKNLGRLSLLNKIKRSVALDSRAPVNPQVLAKIKSRELAELYTTIFGEGWLDIDASMKILYCKNISDPEVEEFLGREKPDLLLDHGTSIVKNRIIENAPLALNLYWGLSPYYRGTHCTEWALINWDPRNIGVTIHRLAKKIDGGDVLCQAQVEPEPHDTVESINMKLSREGTRILIQALALWVNDQKLQYFKQDHSAGYLTLNRQWSRELRQVIKNIEADRGIARMLDKPARREYLPIVEI